MIRLEGLKKAIKQKRTFFIVLASIVVSLTTYSLILPAFTLEKEEALKQGGIDIDEASQELICKTDDAEVRCALENSTNDDVRGDAEADENDDAKDDASNIALDVQEIKSKDKKYDSYVSRAEKAVAKALDKEKSNRKIEATSVYDITLTDNGEETEPENGASVVFEYDKAKKMSGADDVRIVHFVKVDGKEKAEVLDPDDVSVKLGKDGIGSIEFKTESFSVYAIVYTVDFHYEVDGEEFDCSIEGGSQISLKKLLKALKVFDEDKISADDFVADIEKVEFSDEKLVKIKQEDSDYVLKSLKPFDTEETLTITMKNGDVFTVRVTDDKDDAIHNSDGTVQTIPNPQGTTFELFNYYVSEDTKETAWRDQWPGHVTDPQRPNDFWMFDWYDRNGNKAYDWGDGFNHGCNTSQDYLLGYGNNLGINKDHVFKFSPANAGTVVDGTLNTKTVDGANGLNSWTTDADPRQGIVQNTLVDGYPHLTNNASMGTDGTSLAYLFDQTTQDGKDSYGGVNGLLYVDDQGYYTYDSRDFKAEYQGNGTFKVSDQPDTDDKEVKGFWPFGTGVYWVGMHMNTQFSMPENGQVLNPRDELKDMQFEFSGDDDTWLYVDGVLIGDGGGVHNRTEIDINFATGQVTVTGKKDDAHIGTFEETKWLDDLYRAAGKYRDEDWEDIPGTGHKRFKANTYHTFDMFYLERGGGESNLYIHYNLVSTDDFTGHKSYEGFAEDERMQRDQFHFEMIGLDGQYQSVWNDQTGTAEVTKLNDDGRAIMPNKGSEGGAGTFTDPKKEYKSDAYTDSNGNTIGGTVFTTGVLENGDIRFGSAEISAEEMLACDQNHPSLYRYIVREIVPDDAVNKDGITWGEANDEQKKAGGFVKNQVKYDGEVYYMTARVTSWQQMGSDGQLYTEYGLSKTYYTDDTFEEVDNTVSFVDFRNKYAPDSGEVEFEKVDGSNHPLQGAEFTLYTDSACTKIAKDLGDPDEGIAGTDQVKTSGEDGKISFENMAAPRTYYMKETGTPAGYEQDTKVYKVIIEDSKDKTKVSRIIVNGDETETPVTRIVNVKSGELAVAKNWVDQNGRPVSGGNKTARVKIQRKRTGQDTSSRTVNFTITIANHPEHTFTHFEAVNGGNITVDWWDTNQSIQSISVKDSNNQDVEYVLSGYWDDVNHKNRKLTVNGANSDISITVTYPEGVAWLFYSDHTPWMEDVLVQGSPSEISEEDDDFNRSTDATHFAELGKPDFVKLWTIGDQKDFPKTDGQYTYSYYVIEVDDEGNEIEPDEETGLGYKLVGYSDNNNSGINDHGLITVTNRKEVTGSLALQKFVRVNEFDPDTSEVAQDDKNKADGEYTFNIVGKEETATEGQSYEVKITMGSKTISGVTHYGVPTSVTVNGQEAELTDDGRVIISEMVPGEYTVTEQDVDIPNVFCIAVGCTDHTAVTDLDNMSAEVTVSDDDDEEVPKLVTFTNNYSNASDQDIAHISVKKTFTGITAAQIPEDFKVNVKVTLKNGEVKTYTLTGAVNQPSGITFNETNEGNNIVWNWTIAISGLDPDANVEIEEQGHQKTGFTVTSTINGEEGTQSTGTVSQDTVVQSAAVIETAQNSRVFNVYTNDDKASIFVARVVPDQTALVISKHKLNLSERKAVEEKLKNMHTAGDWTNGQPPAYYSFDEASDNKITVRDMLVTYEDNGDGTGKITFTGKKQWNMAATIDVTYVPGHPADFNFVNNYTETGVDLNIVKVDKDNTTVKLPGAKFRVTLLDEENTTAERVVVAKNNSGQTIYSTELGPTDDDGKLTISGLTTGYYMIEESELPSGYVISDDDPTFYIHVDNGEITYIVRSDDPAYADRKLSEWATSNTGSGLVTYDKNTSTATVKNEPGTELPSAGGSGTTWIYILGTLLAIGCSIAIVVRQRCLQ